MRLERPRIGGMDVALRIAHESRTLVEAEPSGRHPRFGRLDLQNHPASRAESGEDSRPEVPVPQLGRYGQMLDVTAVAALPVVKYARETVVEPYAVGFEQRVAEGEQMLLRRAALLGGEGREIEPHGLVPAPVFGRTERNESHGHGRFPQR